MKKKSIRNVLLFLFVIFLFYHLVSYCGYGNIIEGAINDWRSVDVTRLGLGANSDIKYFELSQSWKGYKVETEANTTTPVVNSDGTEVHTPINLNSEDLSKLKDLKDKTGIVYIRYDSLPCQGLLSACGNNKITFRTTKRGKYQFETGVGSVGLWEVDSIDWDKEHNVTYTTGVGYADTDTNPLISAIKYDETIVGDLTTATGDAWESAGEGLGKASNAIRKGTGKLIDDIDHIKI